MDQVALPIGIKPQPSDVADSTLLKQPDILAAIKLAIQESGLQDNQIHSVIEMEKAAFSKSLSGSNHFPAEKLDALCDVLGNEVVLRWWALKRGYGLVPLQSTLEQRVVELEQLVADKDHDLETIKRFVRETS